MNWRIVLATLVATAVVATVAFGIVRAVPNYDDGDEIPPWLVIAVLGIALSFIAGWLT